MKAMSRHHLQYATSFTCFWVMLSTQGYSDGKKCKTSKGPGWGKYFTLEAIDVSFCNSCATCHHSDVLSRDRRQILNKFSINIEGLITDCTVLFLVLNRSVSFRTEDNM